MKILVFIPAKNESKAIAQVITKSRNEIKKFTNFSPEILVIDDGSTDNTSIIAIKNKATTIRHDNNVGLGMIFKEATEYAIQNNIEIMITIDGDGQFNPKDIPNLLKPILENKTNFVTGNRFSLGHNIKNMPKSKQWGNKAMSKIVSSIINKNFQDVSCGFRAYSREALLNLNPSGGFTYTHEVLLDLGFKKIKIKEIPIKVTYFPKRKSRIANNLFKYGINTTKIILSSIIKYQPFKLFGKTAFYILIFSLPIFLTLSIRYLLTGKISPYKAFGSLSVLLITIAILLILIGIILESISKLQHDIDKILYFERKNTKK